MRRITERGRNLAVDISRRLLKPATRAELYTLYVVKIGVIVLMVFFYVNSLHLVQKTQHDDVRRNIEARFSDCENSNETRKALLAQLETGKVERPFLLKLLPQFNTPSALKLIEKNEAEQREGYAERACYPYALKALPPGEVAPSREQVEKR